MNRWVYIFLSLQLIVSGYLTTEFRRAKKQLAQLEKENAILIRETRSIAADLFYALPEEERLRLPEALRYVPFADEQGIVIDVKNVSIPGVTAPYNPSLIEYNGHYQLFFRRDIPCPENANEQVSFYTQIGCAELDEHFVPTGSDIFWVDTHSRFSEDPRVIKAGDQAFMVYNDLFNAAVPKHRGIRIANIDLRQKKINYITALDPGRRHIEKNWMPFLKNGKDLHLIYSISPHEILYLPDPTRDILKPAVDPSKQLFMLAKSAWPLRWGVLRGGTPPCLVDGEYLSFFHSQIRDKKGRAWYVMGAYTFSPEPPYAIQRISRYPILFKGIYNSPHLHTANRNTLALYPAGLVVKERDGQTVLEVSCGENDSNIKIVTISKEALIRSLKKVSASPDE
jgi:hypothetical protein